MGFEKENKLDDLISDFKQKGKLAINIFLDELSAVHLLHKQKLILLEVLIRATEADGVIHPNEVELLHLILPKLSIGQEELIIKFPKQIGYLLPKEHSSFNTEFAEEIVCHIVRYALWAKQWYRMMISEILRKSKRKRKNKRIRN